jgi:hypothetical protein
VKYPLLEYVQAVAVDDGTGITGTCQAEIGPRRYGERWSIQLMSCNTTSNVECQLRIYRGVVSDSAQVMSTYSANNDSAGGSVIELPAGDKLIFVWSNADIGSICTCRIEGDNITMRR